MHLQAVCIGFVTGFSPSNLVLYRLWERENYIAAKKAFDAMLRSFLPDHTPHQARQLAVEAYVEDKLSKQPRNETYRRPRDLIYLAVEEILKRGARWAALLDAVESEAVLLINEDRHLMGERTTLRDVIEMGTDDEFERVRQILLSGENNFKECCLRLSGIQSMIMDLANTPRAQAEVRSYLIKAITARITQIFGEPGYVQDDPLEEKREVFGSFEALIVHVFGIYIGTEGGKIPQKTSPRVLE